MTLGPDTAPRLSPHVRLQHDRVRGQWILQAPERVLVPDDIALAILRRCDGQTTLKTLAEALAVEYDAPPDAIMRDIIALLEPMAARGYVVE